ncbi:CD209 antigen-like, partial [Mercenaria mercenaria]|uniref:CD209 antigen-like n=1 Tax=Mercenaria mercenaria TaxID=6596 RepID=UPI00234F2002
CAVICLAYALFCPAIVANAKSFVSGQPKSRSTDSSSSDSESEGLPGNGLDRCSTQPCKNNGTCIDLEHNYTCICTGSFKGPNCEDSAAVESCPPEWIFNNGSCYLLSSTDRSWTDARDDCNRTGGFLVEIGSAGENEFLLTVNAYFWIGLSDATTEGTFTWTRSESIVSYVNNYVSITNGEEKDCVFFQNTMWLVESCIPEILLPYICEMDAAA